MKRCSDCGKTKELEDFHRDRRNNDGRCWRCKACERERGFRRRKANPEYFRRKSAEFRERNPEYSKEWFDAHPGYKEEYDKQWRAEHPTYHRDYQRKRRRKRAQAARAKALSQLDNDQVG